MMPAGCWGWAPTPAAARRARRGRWRGRASRRRGTPAASRPAGSGRGRRAGSRRWTRGPRDGAGRRAPRRDRCRCSRARRRRGRAGRGRGARCRAAARYGFGCRPYWPWTAEASSRSLTYSARTCTGRPGGRPPPVITSLIWPSNGSGTRCCSQRSRTSSRTEASGSRSRPQRATVVPPASTRLTSNEGRSSP